LSASEGVKVRPVTYRTWAVASSSQPGHEYIVVYDPIRGRFMCSCQGYVVHRTKCKHIMKVVDFLKERGGL
jgi:hypothetical protein